MSLVRRPAAPAPAAAAPAEQPRKIVKRAMTHDPAPSAQQQVREPLHIKYRPQTFDEVVGQEAVVTNLARLFESGRVPHTYLFTGPSGTGKTTLARIVASMVGCEVIEVDAARYNSIDSVRKLIDGAQYAALGESEKKFYLIDECHRLSAPAFDVLLKTTEEPAPHLYWAFCTTEPGRLPNTLRTRSHAYDLKPVHWEQLAEYLSWVRNDAKVSVPDEFVDIAARQANGSVRQALVFLSMLDGIEDKQQALRLVEDFEAQEQGPIELARMLVSGKGASWGNAVKLLADLADVSPETIRLTVLNYTLAAISKESGEKRAAQLLAIMQAFSVAFNPIEKAAPLYIAVGSLLLA